MLGQTINHYKITAKLGEGGMGAVYQATDSRLGRQVALKILPEKFVEDPQRMGRFQREAELLASLNHPHISTIHGLEKSGNVRALVLELVEGPTLAERIAQGPIPVEEAHRLALEMTQALEVAHEKGIIHRDLKPSNVKITPDGKVKVLDFGLAKALETEMSEAELAKSPTLTLEATREGIVMGTAAYMSPEQARGKVVDKRTDIWSFGLILVEMLTGKGMYSGGSLTETIAAVIHQEPKLEELPKETPRKSRELLERCLRKDPRMRLRDIGDARIALQEYLSDPTATSTELIEPSPPSPLWQRLTPWAAVLLLAVAGWYFMPSPAIPTGSVSRFEIRARDGEVLDHRFRHGFALSEDGGKLAYVSRSREDPSKTGIHVRFFPQWGETPVSASENLWQPFFSPDGDLLGAYSDSPGQTMGKLKKFPLDGAPATTICDCEEPYGASWGSDDNIVFACSAAGGLWRVSASGGQPRQITELDKEAGEVSHRFPHLLPGGKAVLFTVLRYEVDSVDWSQAEIAVQSLETGKRETLMKNGVDARYASNTGHFVFAREGTLMACPFDLASLTVTGKAFRVQEGVRQSIYVGDTVNETGAAHYALSASGSLAYVAGPLLPESKREVVWVDPSGREEATEITPKQYLALRLSSDLLRVAVNTFYKRKEIWTHNLRRGVSTPQTLSDLNYFPIWTFDDSSVVFGSNRSGQRNLFLMLVDRGNEAEHLSTSKHPQNPSSLSPDGSKLAFVEFDPKTGSDIWILSMEGARPAKVLLNTRFDETHPEFSPNGDWIAYVTNESGREDVQVRSFPDLGKRTPISTEGGTAPSWSKSGDKLFYRSVDHRKMMSVQITIDGNRLRAGNPVALFEGSYIGSSPIRSYDVHPDGRFLMIRTDDKKDRARLEEFYGNEVRIVLNWFEELKRL